MKYVVLKERAALGMRAVVFGVAPLSHAEIVAGLERAYAPVSAGFCEPLPGPGGKWRVFGESVSLGLKPAAGDELLIQIMTRATVGTADGDSQAHKPALPARTRPCLGASAPF